MRPFFIATIPQNNTLGQNFFFLNKKWEKIKFNQYKPLEEEKTWSYLGK